MKSVDVHGVRIDLGRLHEVVELVSEWVTTKQRSYVCLVNVHVVETSESSPQLSAALTLSGLNLPDGAPVAWLAGRIASSRGERVTGSDLFNALCDGAPLRHFFYGSTPETLARLEDAVRKKYPTAVVCGTHSPPFRPLTPGESEAVAHAINATNPDIVWVGLGAPRQEVWMLENRQRLSAPVLIGVGAVFDFASGMKRRAPAVLQRVGLEWAHRLASEPRRLAGRYVRTNTAFLFRSLPYLLHSRSGRLP